MQEINAKYVSTGKYIKDYAGNSEEESPDSGNLVTGSSIFEVDTGKAYFLDAINDKWIDPQTGIERGANA